MLARLRLWAYAFGVGVMAALFALLRIRTVQRDAARDRADQAEGYIDTRKRIDDATEHLGDDPDLARRWLRERAER